ncbi:MAG: MarR family transcriptional regulator [Rhodothalassiaceae bacterium]|nr:MAG: MarR family transcriptional regulator [Rhodothalassiaceae bacterium]
MARRSNRHADAPRLDMRRLERLLGYRLRMAQVRLFKHFAETLADFAISPAQAGLLILVDDNPEASQSDLARALGIERASLGQTLAQLVAKGLVRKERHPADGRAHVLRLTAEGRAFLDRLYPAIEAHERLFAAALAPDEQEQLKVLLTRLGRGGASGPGEEKAGSP